MRKGACFFIVLFAIVICSESAMATSIDLATNVSTQNGNYPIENLTDIISESLSIGSFIMSILLPSLVVLIFGKEFPKKICSSFVSDFFNCCRCVPSAFFAVRAN